MKKIGILLSSPREVGGIYQYSISIISALNNYQKKKQFNVIYFYTDKIWAKIIPKNSKKKFIKKSKLKKLIFNLLRPTFLNKFFFFIELINEEVEIINNSNCDLVIFPSQNITSYQIKKKSLSTIHDLMHIYESRFKEYSKKIINNRNQHYKMICKYSDGILVDSSLGKKHVLESFPVNKKNIYVLPFVPPEYLRKKDDTNKVIKPPKNYLFYPAQFWEHKNHINLIKAFKVVIKDKKFKNLKLLLCGAKKNNFDKVKELVTELNLVDKVQFLGRVDDNVMRILYKNALATIYPSFCGPTNIPPLEALMMNSPLICSNVYAMKNQVKNAAIFFDPKSTNDIKNKIIITLKNKNLRKKLIQEGKKVLKNYNQHKFNLKLQNYLLSILAQN